MNEPRRVLVCRGEAEARESRSPRLLIYCIVMPAATVVDSVWMRGTLSSARLDPYLSAAGGRLVEAFELYGWNARMSAALLLPAHFAEVVTRNAVVDVLVSVYGRDWSTSPVFERSLPAGSRGYSPRADLVATRKRVDSAGQLVAELEFVFWQHMFAARHDVRLWRPHILEAFPNVSRADGPALRARLLTDLDAIRRLRNRIAHHEPIVGLDLGAELTRMIVLIELRCASTAAWVYEMEDASTVLAERPATLSAGPRRTSGRPPTSPA